MSKGGKKKSKKTSKKKLKDFKVEEIETPEDNLEHKKIPNWLWGIFLVLALIIIAEIGYLYFIFQKKRQPEENVVWQRQEQLVGTNEEEEFKGYPRKIDGVYLESEDNVNLPLAGVMIDNMLNARPPHGLSQANFVIESITESDITRFLAFFDLGTEIDQIGPVRSARPYFAEWASEFGAVYTHSGGSPEALDNLKNGQYNVLDLNEFSHQYDFWRDNRRYPPHNLFTSTELLFDVVERNSEYLELDFEAYKFKEDFEIENRGDDEQEIVIYFNESDHLVKWVYNQEANDYLRYQAGERHLEADSSEIRAKNIAIQYVSMEVLDYVGRKRIDTIDKKPAIIFQDGQVIEGYWQKDNLASRTKFYTNDGHEINFNRGTTWVEVVPVGVLVEY